MLACAASPEETTMTVAQLDSLINLLR